MNYVVANINDEHVTKGKKYSIINFDSNSTVSFVDDHNEVIRIGFDDKDFMITFNG